MNKETKDNPGVVAPPPLIYLSGIIPGSIFTYLFPPGGFLPRNFSLFLGVTLISIAVVIIALALLTMRRAKTNVEPWKPTTAIVSDGVFGISRNPIYLSMTLFYLGVASLVNSVWLFLFLFPVLFVIHYGVILREEQYLERKFGAKYLGYKARVRRWI